MMKLTTRFTKTKTKGEFDWNQLKYWDTGEFQVVEERLRDEKHYCPGSENIFEALRKTPYDQTRVCIVGQDPYPNIRHCTGVAFSVPVDTSVHDFPPTLGNIHKLYVSDLGYPCPEHGSLNAWASQGVLLWNAFPSCSYGKPGSHHWDEYLPLTEEILTKLQERAVVFVFLGRVAGAFKKVLDQADHEIRIIETSHPSPLGVNHGFATSRLFSTINAKMNELGTGTIDWRL